jgi:hypothetical protein
MLRTKMMLFTVVVVALAVPSLWAQRKRLVRPERAANGDPVCIATPTGIPPAGYYAETNKCSSGNANYGFGNSLNLTVGTCADKGGVEVTYDQGLDVVGVGPGNFWPNWGNPFAPANVENVSPNVWGQSIFIATEIGLTLTHEQGVLGLEVSNLTPQMFTVTFHTTVGDIKLPTPQNVGGTAFPIDAGAQRFVAICSGPAIKGVTAHCDSCTETSGAGQTAIAQIRGDKFAGY